MMNKSQMTLNDMVLEIGTASICKHGETVCGDYWCQQLEQDTCILTLSDGMGSGVKANILATLTAKMLCAMLKGNVPIDECVFTVTETLPVCKERKMAYATFTALKIESNRAYLAQYDNPKAILLRNGKSVRYNDSVQFVGEKEIHESMVTLECGDVFILMSDGVTNAGMGKTGDGWAHSDVVKLAEQYAAEGGSPKRLAAHIAAAAQALSLDSVDDDTTVIVGKLRPRHAVSMMIGPPKNEADDQRTLRLFFSKAGEHVVCGGTTAKTVAEYLRKPIRAAEGTGTDAVPAMSLIDGVDLVTEGALTLKALLQQIREYKKDDFMTLWLPVKKDGASRLAELLLEKATDINIFFGTAINAAHNGSEYDFQSKLELARKLEQELQEIGKNVKISMC